MVSLVLLMALLVCSPGVAGINAHARCANKELKGMIRRALNCTMVKFLIAVKINVDYKNKNEVGTK